MIQSVDWAATRTRIRPAARGRIVGGALLAIIYGVVLAASVGLFQTPSTDAHGAAYRVIGLLNVVVLPLLVLAAVVGVRKIWQAGAPNGAISRLLTAPLWISLMLSLLTVPIWMGQANAARQGADAVGLGVTATFLLAPWGFMLAYGLSLFIVCAMHDFTFPIQTETSTPPNTAGRG
jgi:hypothetical protein